MKTLLKAQSQSWRPAAMFSSGLVFLALVASSCAQSVLVLGESLELEQFDDQEIFGESPEISFAAEEVPLWPENYEMGFGLLEDEAVASPETHVTKEPGTGYWEKNQNESQSAVWKVLLVVTVLLLALVGVLSSVYYLCVWRGGRMNYEAHKDVST